MERESSFRTDFNGLQKKKKKTGKKSYTREKYTLITQVVS